MNPRLTVILTILCCCAVIPFWGSLVPAVANGQKSTGAGADSASQELPGDTPESKDKYAYIGSRKCKICHLKLYKSWAKTKMGRAFEILKPGQSVEAKKKHGLDPEKDYTQDKTCLECHVTGFGKKGGYKILDRAAFKNEKAYKRALKKSKNFHGVGCESCHGPGGDYNKVFKEINKSKRKYKVQELYAKGMWKKDIKVCVRCHNERSPTYDKKKPFDYEKEKDKGTHEHEVLKLREGKS